MTMKRRELQNMQQITYHKLINYLTKYCRRKATNKQTNKQINVTGLNMNQGSKVWFVIIVDKINLHLLNYNLTLSRTYQWNYYYDFQI